MAGGVNTATVLVPLQEQTFNFLWFEINAMKSLYFILSLYYS